MFFVSFFFGVCLMNKSISQCFDIFVIIAGVVSLSSQIRRHELSQEFRLRGLWRPWQNHYVILWNSLFLLPFVFISSSYMSEGPEKDREANMFRFYTVQNPGYLGLLWFPYVPRHPKRARTQRATALIQRATALTAPEKGCRRRGASTYVAWHCQKSHFTFW